MKNTLLKTEVQEQYYNWLLRLEPC
jgi:hypothetical protein